jgi:hypothetical protein
MKKKKAAFVNYLYFAGFLVAALLFIAKFAGPSILKLYIETGIGDCRKIPILCAAPQETINDPEINKEYLAELVPHNFAKMTLLVPKGFTVVQERVTKVYYKKRKPKDAGSVFYMYHQEAGFFPKLFPQLQKEGVISNYDFMKRAMQARITNIKTLNDAFFVIVKGILTPDLGDQNNLKMAEFKLSEPDVKGFINYSLAGDKNYFDLNIIDSSGSFFKIYIKDLEHKLDLDKVLAVISTVGEKSISENPQSD